MTDLVTPPVQPKHLLHIFPSFAVGGSQIRFAKLAKLHGARYRHTVISLDGNLEMAARIDDPNVLCKAADGQKRGFIGNTFRYRKSLIVACPSVLVTYNWGAIEWALANRIFPVARHVHIEDGFGKEEAITQVPRRMWMRRLALSGQSTVVIVPSKRLEEIALFKWKLSRERLFFIPNGVDCSRFAPAPATTEKEIIRIGTVAALRPEKNIGRLLMAFDHLFQTHPNAQLLIVGDGPDRLELEKTAKNLAGKEHIFFAGQSGTPEKWMQRMDIFALSSDTEQMPLGVLEAMASGLPIVSTDVGDVAKMVSDQNAPLVVKPDQLGTALQRLAGDLKEQRRLGAANRAKAVELYTDKQMGDRYAALFG